MRRMWRALFSDSFWHFIIKLENKLPDNILAPLPHTSARAGRNAAHSQGTVRAEYCGSASRPSFEHFSFILGPVMLTTGETKKYERTKLTHPSGSGAAVSANEVRAPDGSSQVVQN